VPGVRVDVFASSRANPSAGAARAHTSVPAFDPRLSARLLLTDDLAWLSALGLSHQYPTLRAGAIPAPLVSVPGFPFGDKQLQTAVQGSQGLELALPADVVLSASGFLSVWRGLTDLTADCMQIMPAIEPPPAMSPDQPSPGPMQHPYVCPSNAPVSGRAFGLELLVRRPLSRRLSGWLSYTLARSVRQTHFVTADGGDQVATVASEFDRSHVLNVVLAYDLGRRWRAGARSVFYTGAPYSKLAGNVPVPPYNSQRFPAFFRLDARIEKRWALGQDGFLAFVIEGQNVTLSKEVIGLGLECQGEFGPDGGTTQCTPAKIGPITIPSLGLEASF
jgi:hypothetical protein